MADFGLSSGLLLAVFSTGLRTPFNKADKTKQTSTQFYYRQQITQTLQGRITPIKQLYHSDATIVKNGNLPCGARRRCHWKPHSKIENILIFNN